MVLVSGSDYGPVTATQSEGRYWGVQRRDVVIWPVLIECTIGPTD
jgi:hypothetical protein